ncbi:Dephospho-CoA kinase [Austwickia sp. TVS 96-490-7B]|uniref:nucleoside/nucleotide kinase family protein n=1 Tax=Austwickia sp. TVS 96-490-7B TaxID=2830843 RepID=UPI001D63A39B|nr:nucleoside/nucleotide kinase family protein [Austwickia sp. TVS 96-490-7B]MBW3086047.1 Dephospho-CoA kinase [Austwickia sp. TVS 96-490-7B]
MSAAPDEVPIALPEEAVQADPVDASTAPPVVLVDPATGCSPYPPVTPTSPPVVDEVGAWHRLLDLMARSPERAVLGIAGAPGAGKTTYADYLAGCWFDATVVGMDGFHLAQSALTRLGRSARKGAPDTFDVVGYLTLLRRIRRPGDETVWAPEFRRDLEDPIAAVVPIRPSTRLVITEGNYLLLPEGPWAQAREFCDEVWYVEVPERVRVARLVARHEAYGRSRAQARARATVGVDAENAELIATTRARADVVVTLSMAEEEM